MYLLGLLLPGFLAIVFVTVRRSRRHHKPTGHARANGSLQWLARQATYECVFSHGGKVCGWTQDFDQLAVYAAAVGRVRCLNLQSLPEHAFCLSREQLSSSRTKATSGLTV
jgi:hypothetical protein